MVNGTRGPASLLHSLGSSAGGVCSPGGRPYLCCELDGLGQGKLWGPRGLAGRLWWWQVASPGGGGIMLRKVMKPPNAPNQPSPSVPHITDPQHLPSAQAWGLGIITAASQSLKPQIRPTTTPNPKPSLLTVSTHTSQSRSQDSASDLQHSCSHSSKASIFRSSASVLSDICLCNVHSCPDPSHSLL